MFVWTLHGCRREGSPVQFSRCKRWLPAMTPLGLWLWFVRVETSSARQAILLCEETWWALTKWVWVTDRSSLCQAASELMWQPKLKVWLTHVQYLVHRVRSQRCFRKRNYNLAFTWSSIYKTFARFSKLSLQYQPAHVWNRSPKCQFKK